FDSSPEALIVFWLMKVSIATAVLPVWRSPMISSRWPRPIGTRLSIALRPVCTGSGPLLGRSRPAAWGRLPRAPHRHQAVARLEAGLHRLVHALARNDAGRLDLDARARHVLERAEPVDRVA